MPTFNVKKEWFEKIKSGEKTHEYREFKDYWTDRLVKDLFFGDFGNKKVNLADFSHYKHSVQQCPNLLIFLQKIF